MSPTLLQGGQQRPGPRRSTWALLGTLTILAAAVIVLAFMYWGGTGSDGVRGHRLEGAAVAAPSGATHRRPDAYGVAPAPSADQVKIAFKHPPVSGLLIDERSGRMLWGRDPTRVVPIASLTKMMTALLVVQHEPPDAPVLVTKQALAYQGSGVGVLPRGKRIRLETMLYGLLLPSGNDAAIALAQRVSGTVPRFVDLMNDEAHRLGLTCTHFSSPSGFEDDANHSCARDLAVLARAVLRQPRLARIVRTAKIQLPFPIKSGKLFLYNNNRLLTSYSGADGIKTGYTNRAGRCYVVSAHRGGVRLVAVILHSVDPPGQARRLLDLGFRALHAG